MSRLSDPEDVEVFVGGVEPDPTASLDTERLVEEIKKRPDYPFEAEKAARILAALGSNGHDHGMPMSVPAGK